MLKDELIWSVITEIARIFGKQGVEDDYAWLEDHYGVTEEEDVKWQLIVQHDMDDLPPDEFDPDEPDDQEWIRFLQDDKAVLAFLHTLLNKYRSNDVSYVPQDNSVADDFLTIEQRWLTGIRYNKR